MRLKDIIKESLVYSRLAMATKKQLLEYISTALASYVTDAPPPQLFDALVARERLGATGIGHGVGLPHVHLATQNDPACLVIQLAQPINYHADDGLPVDIIFALLVSKDHTELHLKLLAECVNLLSNTAFRQQFRQTESEQLLYQLIHTELGNTDNHD